MIEEKKNESSISDTQAPSEDKPIDKVKQYDMELNKASSAIKKLVSSTYTCHLLKSTPRNKSIYISFGPLRPNFSWNWLERWMDDKELYFHFQEVVAMDNDKDWSKIEAKEVSDGSIHLKLDGNPSKCDSNEENFKNGAINELSDYEEKRGKLVNGSKKSKNPTFTIIYTIFEELNSALDSNIFIDYALSDVVNVLKSAHSQMVFMSKEVNERKAIY
ncbi:Protein IQ-DOMAIN 32 [Dendrobium catenatum]|uniref:Protein IQ-DOMAIN 32 n=1 Tax=Dendrobium catenatum TaxID=906689 RepID=A0A2I0XAK5_9ASPA|nr:Protein IQ-DOMAIN 32 [Dendrobium catenatum]